MEESYIAGYMEALGIQITQPTVALLNSIAYKHPIVFHYQNLALFNQKELRHAPLSMSLTDLYKRLVVDKLGGVCYEHQLLTYHMMKSLSFDVHLLDSQVAPREPNLHDPSR